MSSQRAAAIRRGRVSFPRFLGENSTVTALVRNSGRAFPRSTPASSPAAWAVPGRARTWASQREKSDSPSARGFNASPTIMIRSASGNRRSCKRSMHRERIS